QFLHSPLAPWVKCDPGRRRLMEAAFLEQERQDYLRAEQMQKCLALDRILALEAVIQHAVIPEESSVDDDLACINERADILRLCLGLSLLHDVLVEYAHATCGHRLEPLGVNIHLVQTLGHDGPSFELVRFNERAGWL